MRGRLDVLHLAFTTSENKTNKRQFTNLTDAVWQTYSSNIVVSLNSGNGVYNVLVGLRGLPLDAMQTWQSNRVSKYSVSPVLTITNPVSTMVSAPMIQLQGWVNEALSSLTFDVSNASGIFTNQIGYWQAAFYDTHLLAFTTNSFQCYDVALTNGLNSITLHATDLTGNTTTTNFYYTLSYAGVTNPPEVTLLWPTNGTVISGSNFTMQAQVSDATATVTATINSNTVQGLVERSGAVWFEDLPLAAGTNLLTLTATGASGNATTTNITLIQSSVLVTMDPLAIDQCNQTNVSVTGTINDTNSTYDIYVNGVAAYYTDDAGDWKADGVAVTATGTATFAVEIYAAGSVRAGSRRFNVVQPAVVSLMSYVRHSHSDETLYGYCSGAVHNVGNEVVNWLYQSGGVSLVSGSGKDGDCNSFNHNYTTSLTGGFNGYGPDWETAAISDSYDYDESYYWSPGAARIGNDNDAVQTKVMIVPAGQQAIGQSALYLVAAQVLDEDSGLQLAASAVQFLHQLAGTTTEDVTNDDGSVWSQALVSAPAGVQVEVTPIAFGNIFFGGMKISPAVIVYISVDPSGKPTTFDANAVQTTLQSQLSTNVFDSPPAGHSVQVKVVEETTPSGKPGWNGNPKTSYFNRITWGTLIGNYAFSDHLGNTKIDTMQVDNYYAAHGGTPSAQSWANYFAHEVLWLNAGGNHDCIFSCVNGEISSGTEDAYSKYTVLSSSRSALRGEFGF